MSEPMPQIIFEGKETLTVEAEGGDLGDLCDAVRAPVPFSCRSASCATCRIHVLEGMDHFLPPEDEELDILEMLEAPKDHRLACCVKIKAGPGKIRVKPLNDY